MSKDYRGYLTQAGLNYESTAHALGKVVNIAKIGIGNGVLPDDQSPMGLTAMVNKIAEFPAKVYQDEKNPGVFVAECAIPAEHAINGTGYYINEMSAILDNGILYAYRRVSGDFKPLITSGEAKSYLYRLRFIPQNAGVVNVTIDPSVVWPTLADLKREIQRHEESRNHPDASLTEKGFVQLSSATDSTSETLAATPKAVKTVHDLAAGKYTAEDATTAKRGLVQLSNATNSASESTAATSKAVKTAYDLAAGKYTAENATTSKRGLVQLSSATDSTSETLAATPKAVKTVHDLAASKAPVNSPALTGHPTAPTPVDSAVGQEIATAAFVVAKIAKLVNSSPAALDTLQELAAALGNDPNFSATVMNLIGQKLSKDQNGADIPDKQRFIDNLGLRDAVNKANAALQKNQNGADIPNKPLFIDNLGLRDTVNKANAVYSHTHTAAQGNHDVISGAWNAVGATVFARVGSRRGESFAPGVRVDGVRLYPANAGQAQWGSLPGTWQCQGCIPSQADHSTSDVCTVWIRVA
ncbi:tail fiber protein [Plesiomonas shigelloides]|uniref:Tail fiber protein n=1 Tax=Plesiomonas shigelloides TaxID=703 RepID=A0A8I1W9H7_PLESH|nr:tail fiber protein [Plesiomonas shigelloides]